MRERKRERECLFMGIFICLNMKVSGQLAGVNSLLLPMVPRI